MRIPPSTLGLTALMIGLAGCTQPGGLRVTTPSEVKTTASVGDQALPVVAGLPGEDRQIADAPLATRRSNPARLSGRVYDEEGEPVRNAVIRLAMSGSSGGKLLHTTTDRSGAFTLRGVRQGSTYTVIAEYQGDQGIMTGRTEAEAPDTNLEISLHPRDAKLGRDEGVAATPRSPRAARVARTADEDDSVFEPADRPEERKGPSRSIRPRLDAETAAPDEPDERPVRKPLPDEPEPLGDDFEDDGENPLPPAREISKVSARTDNPASHDEAADGVPRRLPDDFIEDGESMQTTRAQPPQERARPTWSDVASEGTNVPLDEQVAQTHAVGRAAAEAPAPPPISEAELEPEGSRAAPVLVATDRRRSVPADLEARRKAPYCDYDDDERRIVRFAMLDMNGKKVSLNDFDSELILLDFWGSWCVQCGPALEHMKELQSRLGGKRLQVVSVAYEKTPKEGRVQKLAEVVRGMGLNFPVLMTDFSDPCPVREALAVDVFPTMILIDREGKILRRERGATPTTLGNIDRAIADHFERAKGPQYARREPRGRATR